MDTRRSAAAMSASPSPESGASGGARPAPGAPQWIRLVLVGGFAIGGLFFWLDRGSLQRGNRLAGEGSLSEAAELYRSRASDPEDAVAAFNLGTVLLDADPEEARVRLQTASALPGVDPIEAQDDSSAAASPSDSLVAERARYNLGYAFLTAARADVEADSAVALLRRAVENNRAAIRLRPGDDDARWNLAVAERMLDSLGHRPLEPDYEITPGEDETRVDLNALVRSETGEGASGLEPETPNPGEAYGERTAPREGARESWTSQDPGPLDGAAALRYLTGVKDGPEQLIRGLLWSHRPDVAWWDSAPYPGGGW
jgi:hypothetical protein